MSIVPTNQSYRPLVTASLALDYRLGRGLNLVYFQAVRFFWYVVQLVLMFFLFHRIHAKDRASREERLPGDVCGGMVCVAPASAETVNYIIQRADLYVALGMVAGLLAFMPGFPGRESGGSICSGRAGRLVEADRGDVSGAPDRLPLRDRGGPVLHGNSQGCSGAPGSGRHRSTPAGHDNTHLRLLGRVSVLLSDYPAQGASSLLLHFLPADWA